MGLGTAAANECSLPSHVKTSPSHHQPCTHVESRGLRGSKLAPDVFILILSAPSRRSASKMASFRMSHSKSLRITKLTTSKIAIVSLGNSIQCYISLDGSRAVYTGTSGKKPSPTASSSKALDSNPVNALSARTFGTWTALSSIVRMYAAYNIDNPQVYQICLWTYGIAFAHFFSEWLVFGSAKWGKGLGSPVAVSTITTVWMLSQWSYYVR